MECKLSSLLNDVPYAAAIGASLEYVAVTGVTDDSRQVKPGFAFLAYPGETVDGRNYIDQALDAGAAALIVEAGWMQKNDGVFIDKARLIEVPVIEVSELRMQCGVIASRFYDEPSKQLKIIGVTGTNGKTSVAYLMTQLLVGCGYKAAMIGTLGTGELHSLSYSENTTPGAMKLQSLLASFVAQSIDCLVVEVSSIAVEQGRINGMDFDVVALTNFSRDHLDYHKTMEAYAQAKMKFIKHYGAQKVINIDDALGQRVIKDLSEDAMTFGHQAQSNAQAKLQTKNLRDTLSGDIAGMSFELSYGDQEFAVKSGLVGRFNHENLLTVIACALTLQLPLTKVLEQIEVLRPPVGRLELMTRLEDNARAIVDYAHTPDAIEKLLSVVNQVSDNNVSLVFGCGGDRDKGKRVLMAQAAEQSAKTIWLTSDNPRTENPQHIIFDIAQGFKKSEHVNIVIDREEAITKAAAALAENEVLVVAGKGHENYQEIMGVRNPFSDQEVLKSLGFTHDFLGDVA